MSESMAGGGLTANLSEAADHSTAFMNKLAAVAQADACVGVATSANGHTVFPIGSVNMMAGYGFGFGEGSGDEGSHAGSGSGGGGGGGGRGSATPVAIVDISDTGVEVRPVLDYTKIVLAVLVLIGTMALRGRGSRSRKGS